VILAAQAATMKTHFAWIQDRVLRLGAVAATLVGCVGGGVRTQVPSTSAPDAEIDVSSGTPDARAVPDAGGDGATSADRATIADRAADTQPDGPAEHGDGPSAGRTSGGVPLPAGWKLVHRDKFGTAPGNTVTTFAELHARYHEGMYYNRDASGRVKIPNVVINKEQQTYSHFEQVIAWSADHLTIQARGQPDGSITSGELVSVYVTRNFCTEARYRIPSQPGSWPAFWFYAATTGGDKSEIDVEQPIAPNQGVSSVSLYNHPSQSDIVIADPAFTTRWMTWTKASFDASAAVHTYTVCYDDAAAQVSRHIDGALVYTARFKWNESLGGTGMGPDAATIVNLAVGGSWPGNVSNPSAFSADLDVYSLEYYGP
jgi:hypothetical protein